MRTGVCVGRGVGVNVRSGAAKCIFEKDKEQRVRAGMVQHKAKAALPKTSQRRERGKQTRAVRTMFNWSFSDWLCVSFHLRYSPKFLPTPKTFL